MNKPIAGFIFLFGFLFGCGHERKASLLQTEQIAVDSNEAAEMINDSDMIDSAQ